MNQRSEVDQIPTNRKCGGRTVFRKGYFPERQEITGTTQWVHS